MKRVFLFLQAVLITLLLGSNASALTVVGESQLAEFTNLEIWLGKGPITLTNIYSADAADGISNGISGFHAAVDGRGPTITLIKVSETGDVLGGYTAVSWGSVDDYVTDDAAFIFNLTNNDVRYVNSGGLNALADFSDVGPTFGGGHDLGIISEYIYNYSYSYLAKTRGGLVVFDSGNDAGIAGGDFTWERIEVFTVEQGEGPLDGISCWDLNLDGVADKDEDIDGNGSLDAYDCIGPKGPRGPRGIPGPVDISLEDFNQLQAQVIALEQQLQDVIDKLPQLYKKKKKKVPFYYKKKWYSDKKR